MPNDDEFYTPEDWASFISVDLPELLHVLNA